jgi:uncharacterized protein YndB with AHSA1/START domain
LKRTEVNIERLFEVPPSRIYEAWTNPEIMSRWIWAGLGTESWAESDLRVGGAYRAYTKLPGGTHQGEDWSGMCGLYVEIVPDCKLVYTVHWDADVFYNRPENLTVDEIVIVTFSPEEKGTRMSFTHMGIPDDGMSVGPHQQGLEVSFDLLASLL